MNFFTKAARSVAAVAVLLAAVLPVQAQAQSALDKILSAGKIVIAVQNDVPPYSQIGANNEVEGMDIDIAKAIARDLGVELEMVVVTGANRIPTLVANRADLVIATVAINPQRAAAVALSDPYTSYPMVLIAPHATQMTSYADTAGKVIGLTRGTMQDDIITRNAPDATIQRYDDDATVIQALATGQIDATAFGSSVAAELGTRFPDLKLEPKFDAFSSFAAIAMRRSDADLLQWVNTWIFFNKHNGYLNELHQKWMKMDMPQLP
jgi:polar amino acid transport system substrate-binding protein